jgi:cysteine desulfurase
VLDPELAEGLRQREATLWANPESPHPAGRAAAAALNEARTALAHLMGAAPKQLTFTGGGTEAVTLAMLGSAGQGWPPRAAEARAPRVAISAAEHACVRSAATWLARHRGFEVDAVPVDAWGRVQPEALAATLRPETRVVALILANNEVGTLNDLPSLAAVVRAQAPRARLVVDAVQALGKVPLSVAALDADAVAVTAHKLNGPKHIGALYLRRPVEPVQRGGGQQDGQRGGTLSAPLAWAFAEAARRHLADMPRVEALRDRLWQAIVAAVPEVRLTGAPFGPERLPNHLHLCVPGLPTEPLLNALGARGLCVSAGAACSGDRFSHVLAAMGRTAAEGAWLRLCPGRFTTDAEVDRAALHLAAAVAELRAWGLGR